MNFRFICIYPFVVFSEVDMLPSLLFLTIVSGNLTSTISRVIYVSQGRSGSTLKGIVQRKLTGVETKINYRYCFSFVVLGIIFHFQRDAILDSFKKVLPSLQHKKFKFYTSLNICCKFLQHQLILEASSGA
jgi:hypothetical protein